MRKRENGRQPMSVLLFAYGFTFFFKFLNPVLNFIFAFLNLDLINTISLFSQSKRVVNVKDSDMDDSWFVRSILLLFFVIIFFDCKLWAHARVDRHVRPC